MNNHLPAGFKIPFMLLALILAQGVVAQQDCRVRYLYDDAGNRTKRYWLCSDGVDPKMASAGEQLDLVSLKVMPNPANDRAELRLVNSLPSAQVEVLDMQGKSVLKKTMTGDQTILDVSTLSNGLYSVRVFAGAQMLICPLSVQR